MPSANGNGFRIKTYEVKGEARERTVARIRRPISQAGNQEEELDKSLPRFGPVYATGEAQEMVKAKEKAWNHVLSRYHSYFALPT